MAVGGAVWEGYGGNAVLLEEPAWARASRVHSLVLLAVKINKPTFISLVCKLALIFNKW